jgi:hypothetical protein
MARDAWFSVGLASSFPNITESTSVTLSEPQLCDGDDNVKQACRVFLAPNFTYGDDSRQAVQISEMPEDQVALSLRRGDQVLVFQYKGKFHAIDNVRAITPTW